MGRQPQIPTATTEVENTHKEPCFPHVAALVDCPLWDAFLISHFAMIIF